MWRKSILARLSPITPEVKAVVLEKPGVDMVKHLSLVFIFSILFAAGPADAQDKEFKLEIKSVSAN